MLEQPQPLSENVVVTDASLLLEVPIWKLLVHFGDILKCGQIWVLKDNLTESDCSFR